MRDVTKTKPSHHRPQAVAGKNAIPPGPSTFEGMQLAVEVQASPRVSAEVKVKLTREIADYEVSHGSCTQTFIKKIRKQIKTVN